jgi:hypothetical protein
LPKHPTTPLARGQINHDKLILELVEPTGQPPMVRIVWPAKPTVCTPAQLDAVVAAAMRILSASVIKLAAIRVWKKL